YCNAKEAWEQIIPSRLSSRFFSYSLEDWLSANLMNELELVFQDVDWPSLFDGAHNWSSGLACSTVVARDEHGRWMWGIGRNIDRYSVQQAELWAIYEGLQLAWEANWENVIVETDRALAIKGFPIGARIFHVAPSLVDNQIWLDRCFLLSNPVATVSS
ncbi:hypothetical protein Goari_024468, partial [Gossypium aridum]|nr:hypothetical protein [Gossypium aridum]